MKDNIISIDLGAETAPYVKEVHGADYIEYGTEDWANLYPQFLIDLYYNSSTNAAIINATAEMISGEDIVIDDEKDYDIETVTKLKLFLEYANSNESLYEVIKKVAFDFKLQGAFALNLVWSKDRTEIAEIYHIPVEKIRAEKPDSLGKICGYYVSSDWGDIRNNKPHRIPAFNPKDRTSANQILYTGIYSPNMNAYFTPDYLAGNNWSLIDQKVSEFHLNNIKNGFSGSYFISFANGVPTREERVQIERSLTQKFTGSENAGKFILTFSDDKTRTPEITPVSVADQDKLFLSLQELLVQNILTAHRVTSPMLMGIKNDTGLGSNVDELNSAANFYLNTVVKPFQVHILKTFKKILRVNQIDLPLSFIQLKPITLEFTSEDLKGIMTEDELREEMGLAPLDVEVREDFSKAEKTELDSFIENYGEEIPTEWEMIDEENVNDEHEEFNFEEVLNDAANGKLDLASTGTARPNARSEQDGVNKSYNDFFKVRYVYKENKSLTNKTGQVRPFCKKMVSAQKVYRKEDIIRMEDMVVNDYYYSERQQRDIGWGPNGEKKYSCWLYKGGGNCQHYWRRLIYKTSLRGAKKNINPEQLISYTKARSDGFTAEKNDSLVAKAPKTMPNNGFLPSNKNK